MFKSHLASVLSVIFGTVGMACSHAPVRGAAVPVAAASPAVTLDMGALRGRAGQRLQRAVDDMDAGDVARAIASLTRLHEEFPRHGIVLHELGLAYRMHREPAKAVKVLSPYQDSLPADLLAGYCSALDESGNSQLAERLLREGLGKYPRSGLLHSELGTLLAAAGKTLEAITQYELGIGVEPDVSSNYHNAAHLLADGPRRGMALVYGEIFRLLEPDSPRSRHTAELMVKLCQNAVELNQQGDKSKASVSLAPNTLDSAQADPSTLPFENAFELSFGLGLIGAHVQGLSLHSLHSARRAFVEILRRPEAPRSLLAQPLMRWLIALDDAGHLETYDFWLYGPGFPEEAAAWLGTSEANFRLRAMAKYIVANPLFPKAAKSNPDTI